MAITREERPSPGVQRATFVALINPGHGEFSRHQMSRIVLKHTDGSLIYSDNMEAYDRFASPRLAVLHRDLVYADQNGLHRLVANPVAYPGTVRTFSAAAQKFAGTGTVVDMKVARLSSGSDVRSNLDDLVVLMSNREVYILRSTDLPGTGDRYGESVLVNDIDDDGSTLHRLAVGNIMGDPPRRSQLKASQQGTHPHSPHGYVGQDGQVVDASQQDPRSFEILVATSTKLWMADRGDHSIDAQDAAYSFKGKGFTEIHEFPAGGRTVTAMELEDMVRSPPQCPAQRPSQRPSL